METMWVLWTEKENERKIPKWARTAGMDREGTIWIPAGIFGSETMIFICLGCDGTPSILRNKHLYIPSSWAKQEYHQHKDTISTIEKAVKDFAANQQPKEK